MTEPEILHNWGSYYNRMTEEVLNSIMCDPYVDYYINLLQVHPRSNWTTPWFPLFLKKLDLL